MPVSPQREVGVVFGGCAVPTVIINSGSTGHRVGAVHFKVLRWLSSLNQNVDHTGSLTVVSACKDKNQRVSVQDSMESRAALKNDMLIMSEVRKSSLAFNAWGTRCNSLFASFSLSLTCCHFICLSFFFIFPSPAFFYTPHSLHPSLSHALWDWGTETAV